MFVILWKLKSGKCFKVKGKSLIVLAIPLLFCNFAAENRKRDRQ